MDTETRKSQIIDATLTIIAEKGVGRFKTAEIAREVGVSEGAIFRHFRNKEEIVRAVQEHVRETLLVGARTALNSAGPGPREKIGALLRFQLTLIEQNPGIPRLFFSGELLADSGDLKELVRKTVQDFLELLSDVFRQAKEEGLLREGINDETAAQAYLGLVQVAMLRWMLDGQKFSLTGSYNRVYEFLSQSLFKETSSRT